MPQKRTALIQRLAEAQNANEALRKRTAAGSRMEMVMEGGQENEEMQQKQKQKKGGNLSSTTSSAAAVGSSASSSVSSSASSSDSSSDSDSRMIPANLAKKSDETDANFDTEEICELVFDFGDILTDLYRLPGRKATSSSSTISSSRSVATDDVNALIIASDTARHPLVVDEIREAENKRQPIEENKRHNIAAFAKEIMIKFTAKETDLSNCFPVSSKLLNGIEKVLKLQDELDTINNIMKNPSLGCTLINLLCKELAKKVSKEKLFRSFLSMTKWLDDMIFNKIDTLKEHISSIPIAKKPDNSETFQNEGIYLTSSIWKNHHTCNRRQRSYVNSHFDSLPTQAKAAVVCLGYDKTSWENFGSASSDGIEWKDLTPELKEAAVLLGYDYEDWAELQAGKKSTITTTENNSNDKAEEENSGSSNGGKIRANNKRSSDGVSESGSGKRSRRKVTQYQPH